MHRMTILSIHPRRDAFWTKGHSNNASRKSFDQNSQIDDRKDVLPGNNDHARFA
jgi:hypothetical protein